MKLWGWWRRKTDIAPGWQERVAKLRELIRTCQHKGKRLHNAEGVPFCADCGRHMDEDER